MDTLEEEIPQEMIFQELPIFTSGLPNWVARNLNMVLETPLSHSKLTLAINKLYLPSTKVKDINLWEPEDFIGMMGAPFLHNNLNFAAELLVVLHFLFTMVHEPKEYGVADYLDLRGSYLVDYRTTLLKHLRQKTSARSSTSRVQRLSPNGRDFGSARFQSRTSPQSNPVMANVSNVSSGRLLSSHPNFIASPGSDVEEELSESESQAEAQNQVDAMEAEAFYQDQADQAWYQRVRGAGNRSVKSLQGSIRSMRKEDYRRNESPPKSRSNVSSDKLQWDGKRSTYATFAADLVGTLLRLGLGYLVNEDVMDAYAKEGMDYIKSDPFWAEFGISVKQFKYDVNYLYGLLLSSTKKMVNPYIVQHRHDKNGLLVWIKFEKAYAFGGSKSMRSEELEDKLLTHYNPREYDGVAEYIDKFQSWMEQLDALGTRNYNDASKKRILLRNLKTDPNLLTLIQIC